MMLSGSEAPHGSHPAGPALAQRRAQPLPQNPCTESLGAAGPREGGRTPLLPPPTGAGRGLGGRGGLCRDARGVGRVPLSLPGCGAWRGRLRATRALGTQGGEG